MAIFTLTGPNKGKTDIYGGFTFSNGVCEVQESDADKAERLLCRYYGAVRGEAKAETKPQPKKSTNTKNKLKSKSTED
jgi:hypothetical protein